MPPTTTLITVRLQPRASRDEVLGWNQEGVRVLVKAPPADGAANVALIQLLAKTIGVSKAKITLVAGAKVRNKITEIQCLTNRDLKKRLRTY